jgi:hypothetical protein
MKANRAFHLIVAREGLEPAFLADPERVDRIEVVSVSDGELAWYWELPPKDASKLIRALRADLVALDVDAFIDKWVGADE